MILVNIVYDKNDFDIISIPDSMKNTIKAVAQDYLDWFPPQEDHYHWREIDGRTVMCKTTQGFVEWLNDRYCKSQEKAQVIKINSKLPQGIINVSF